MPQGFLAYLFGDGKLSPETTKNSSKKFMKALAFERGLCDTAAALWGSHGDTGGESLV
jgi:hypothetical protein